MINKRLMNKLGSAKIFIGLTVLLQSISLLANVALIFSIARLLENVLRGAYTSS